MRRWNVFVYTLAAAALLFTACGGQDAGSGGGSGGEPELTWAGWRGPDGLGISTAGEPPMTWDRDGAGLKWSAEIGGAGTSSPIVADGRVYVTSATVAQINQPIEMLVHAFDLDTGERLWRTSIGGRGRERMHRMNTSAGPTPATDGRHVFVYFGSHLAALDIDGDVVWTKEIDTNYLEESRYAAGSSVFLYDDKVIILRDRERVADELVGWIAAYDKATGEQVWKKKFDDSCCSYVTPMVIDGDDGDELFIVLAGYVAAYDPETGKRRWRQKQGIAQPVASPVKEDGLMCVASGAHGHREAICWEEVDREGQRNWKPLWRYSKWVPDTSSPVLSDGRLFLLTEKGILRSVNARTGKLLWQRRLSRAGAGYRASLLAAAGKLYAVGQSGETSIVAMEDGEILAVNTLPEENYLASPALAGDCLLIRSDVGLYCVDGA